MANEFRYTSLGDALATLSRSENGVARRETVDLREAYGRVLASDIAAQEDSPRKDVSHFDGYAVASADTMGSTRQSPVSLSLRSGVTRVGLFPKGRVARGSAMKIATGGFIPAGADAVVALEDASLRGDVLWVTKPVERGAHVYPAGADVKKGERLLRRGKTLTGQDLVLLASLHAKQVVAFRRPRVAIIPTGSELTSQIGDRKSGKVVESHSLLLRHLVEEAGGVANTHSIVPDDARAITLALKKALRESDVVLTLAGSSVGEPDLVESAIRDVGKSSIVLVHGVKVHRGRVMGFAVANGKAIVILPGPIQGALNAFIVFGYPLIRRHLGRGMESPPSVPAAVGEDWEATGKFRTFDQIVYLHLGRDPIAPSELLAMPSSGDTEKVSFLVSKNAYAMVTGPDAKLRKGERVQAHLLPGFSSLEE